MICIERNKVKFFFYFVFAALTFVSIHCKLNMMSWVTAIKIINYDILKKLNIHIANNINYTKIIEKFF